MMHHNFETKLSFSVGERERVDEGAIRRAIPGCVAVEKTDAATDKTGVDYIARLRRGAVILIDAKARERGASKWWRDGKPELALEIWSVIPDEDNSGKVGWTLSECDPVDYILYTFDPADTNKYYLIPFQLLRIALVRHFHEWREQYGTRLQYSSRWVSEAMFVPADVVLQAVSETMFSEQGVA